MPDRVRQSPPNSFPISQIADHSREQGAAKYDIGQKGYLTYDELVAFYQSENAGRIPTSPSDIAGFLGVPQHRLEAEFLQGWEIFQSQWLAASWKGDFHIDGFSADDPSYRPAGNVRVGREIGPQADASGTVHDVDQTVFLVDFNFVRLEDFDRRVRGAFLVIAPEGWSKEYAQAPYPETTEVPLTLLSQDAYRAMGRFGPGDFIPDRKLLAAQVDTEQLRDFAGAGKGISFWVRLELHDGRTFAINKDGKSYNNFDMGADELKDPGTP